MDIDSSFYGHSDTVQALEDRVNKFDPQEYLRTPPTGPRAMRERQIKTEGSPSCRGSTADPTAQGNLHNPYAGVPYAWQLSERVDDFLERLPPSTTEATPDCPWIYICNPFVDAQDRSGAPPRGCEDEGPQRPGAQLSLFVEGASERLRMFENIRAHLVSATSSSQAFALISKERGDAVADIAALAQNLGVTCGKWMLFPEPDEVDEVWAVVARATARGELGVAAKVAPRPEDGVMGDADKRARLICVYTADFGDKQDVGRVLLSLKKLGLVPPTGRPIYYKTDAYTYLGIAGGNKWDIKASLYDSRQIVSLLKGG